ARRSPALVERPDDEALAAPTITRGENAGDIGGIFTVVGFDIRAGIAVDFKGVEQQLFGPEETHSEKHELAGQHFFGAGNFAWGKAPLCVLIPFDLNGERFFDPTFGI